MRKARAHVAVVSGEARRPGTQTSALSALGSHGQPTFYRLARLVGGWWRLLALALIAALCNNAAAIGLPVTGALIVGQVARGATPADLTPYLIALGALVVSKSVFTWLEMWLNHNLAYGMLAWLRSTAYTALEPLAPAYTLQRRGGDIVSMVTADIEHIELFYAHTVVPAIVVVLVPTGLLISLAVIAPSFSLVLLPFLAIAIALPLVSRRMSDPVARQVRDQQGQVNAHLVDSLQGLREIMAFGRGDSRAREITSRSERLAQLQLRYSHYLGVFAGATETVVSIGALSLLLVGASLVAAGAIARYELPLVLVLAFAAFVPVANVATVARNLSQVAAAARRFFAVIDEPVLVQERTPHAQGSLPPAIEFDGVTFAYHRDQPPVLRNLSFVVHEGETVALVGPSGAGKSTCVSLLLRFWDPNEGVIRLGGVDLRDFPLNDLRTRTSVVQQDNYLFNTTIRENICLGKPLATQEEVETAARAAYIHDFILGLPQRYETIVGERGARLSGGQRQRIALARAFLKDAPILILDEATSNLDTENERLIKAAVAQLMTGRTTLVIAHRLSTILSADRVVMIDRGRGVAVGTHAELLAQEGAYAQLVAAQRQGLEPNHQRPEQSAESVAT